MAAHGSLERTAAWVAEMGRGHNCGWEGKELGSWSVGWTIRTDADVTDRNLCVWPLPGTLMLRECLSNGVVHPIAV